MTDQLQNIFLHNPAQSTKKYISWAEKRQGEPGVDFGCALDKKIIPLHPGDLMAIVARPGHGKSSFMAYMAKREARRLASQSEGNKCVIYVSWEQSIEELEAFFQSGDNYNSTDLAWGRVDLGVVKEQAVKRVNLPIWMIGYSVGDANKKKPPMYIEQVYEAIRDMRYKYGFEPTLICLDYLQIVPVKGVGERAQQVFEATVQAKHLAMEIGVPIIGGVQASRQVDNRGMQIPTLADAQWSSGIEQTADKQLALFRPVRVMDEGEEIDIGGSDYRVDKFLLIAKLLKQRFDEGFGIWPLHFEPHTLILKDYVTYDLNA